MKLFALLFIANKYQLSIYVILLLSLGNAQFQMIHNFYKKYLQLSQITPLPNLSWNRKKWITKICNDVKAISKCVRS